MNSNPELQAVNPPQVQAVELQDDGKVPNSRLPLLLYKGALSLESTRRHPAALFEELFEANRWGHGWRNGVFGFQHYHSTAHEVLGVYSGSATIQFGGENGVEHTVQAGDAVIIPAGVAHRNVSSTRGFAVVGAYPQGQDYDMCYGKPEERPHTDRNIAAVAIPQTDPIYGADGPLFKHWKEVAHQT